MNNQNLTPWKGESLFRCYLFLTLRFTFSFHLSVLFYFEAIRKPPAARVKKNTPG
jgi:hypothetical protein